MCIICGVPDARCSRCWAYPRIAASNSIPTPRCAAPRQRAGHRRRGGAALLLPHVPQQHQGGRGVAAFRWLVGKPPVFCLTAFQNAAAESGSFSLDRRGRAAAFPFPRRAANSQQRAVKTATLRARWRLRRHRPQRGASRPARPARLGANPAPASPAPVRCWR